MAWEGHFYCIKWYSYRYPVQILVILNFLYKCRSTLVQKCTKRISFSWPKKHFWLNHRYPIDNKQKTFSWTIPSHQTPNFCLLSQQLRLFKFARQIHSVKYSSFHHYYVELPNNTSCTHLTNSSSSDLERESCSTASSLLSSSALW